VGTLRIYRANREDAPLLETLFKGTDFGTAKFITNSMYRSAYVIRRRMISGNEYFYFMRDDDEAVGCVTLSRRGENHVVAIASILVTPERRRTGLGARLLDFAMGEAGRLGSTKVYAHVASDNVPARILFATRHFLPEGLLKDQYGAGTWAIAYGRRLPAQSAAS
jgi:ribosomal protein S18 acetylase RimI-like enzyme